MGKDFSSFEKYLWWAYDFPYTILVIVETQGTKPDRPLPAHMTPTVW